MALWWVHDGFHDGYIHTDMKWYAVSFFAWWNRSSVDPSAIKIYPVFAEI